MMKVVLISFILSFISCQTHFQYEGAHNYGKSYLSRFDVFEINTSDSALVKGNSFVKKKTAFKSTYARLYWINKNQDTVKKVNSDMFGYSFYIKPGIYRCMVESSDHRSVCIDSVIFQKGKLYLMDFLFQKGSGSDQWFMKQ